MSNDDVREIVDGARPAEPKDECGNVDYTLLNGLAERAKEDVGEPFRPEVVKALAAQKMSAQHAFEALLADLRKVGVRMRPLEKAIAKVSQVVHGEEDEDDDAEEADNLASGILRLAHDAELFHSEDDEAFATVAAETDGKTRFEKSVTLRNPPERTLLVAPVPEVIIQLYRTGRRPRK